MGVLEITTIVSEIKTAVLKIPRGGTIDSLMTTQTFIFIYARERAKHLPDVGINGIEIPVETLRIVLSPFAEGMSFLHIRTKQS